jgi:hypothetical protein
VVYQDLYKLAVEVTFSFGSAPPTTLQVVVLCTAVGRVSDIVECSDVSFVSTVSLKYAATDVLIGLRCVYSYVDMELSNFIFANSWIRIRTYLFKLIYLKTDYIYSDAGVI